VSEAKPTIFTRLGSRNWWVSRCSTHPKGYAVILETSRHCAGTVYQIKKDMGSNMLHRFSVVMAALFLFGCSDLADRHRQAVQSGRRLQVIQEIDRLFPDKTQHFIGHTGGVFRWNSEVLLHDRYVLTMQAIIEVNPSFTEVQRFIEEPKFYLVEIGTIRKTPSGQWNTIGVSQEIFGIHKWNMLVAANGDFRSIGIELKKNQPIVNFDLVHEEIRNQRMQ